MSKKKPKGFGFYYLKHGLACLGLWLFFLFCGFCYLGAKLQDWLDQDNSQRYFSFKEGVMQAVSTESMEKRQAALTFIQPNSIYPEQQMAGISSITYVADGDTKETVGLTDCNAKEFTFLVVFDRDKEFENYGISGDWTNTYETVYYCKNDVLRQYLGDLDSRIKAWNAKIDPLESPIKQEILIQIESYYVKDAYFLPGRISLKYEERNGLGTLRWEEVLETVTYEPEDPVFYEYFEADIEKQHVYSSVDQLYEDNQELIKRWDKLRDRAKEYASHIGEEYTNYYDPYQKSVSTERFLTMPKKSYYAREFLFRDGTNHVYQAVFYSETDMRELMLSSVLFGQVSDFGVKSFMVLFITAFLMSEWEYRKKRYAYMTEGYRDMLIDTMAHDLKSPLMAISGYAENLGANLKEGNLEKSAHYADKIYENAGYVSSLITKNLELLRRDGNGKKLEKKTLDFRKLFEEAFARYQGELEKRELTVKVEGMLSVKGDEEMLKKVADNLVTNAIQHATEGTEIIFMFDKKSLSIRNQAELTYQGKLKNLWEPFVRGEESRNGRGNGLGLAIAANVMDRHGWKYALSYDQEKKTFTCKIMPR